MAYTVPPKNLLTPQKGTVFKPKDFEEVTEVK